MAGSRPQSSSTIAVAPADAAGFESVCLLDPTAEPVGRFHAWWRGDPAALLPDLPGLTIGPAADLASLGKLTGIGVPEIEARLRRRHQPWLARVAGEPVGWGWIAAAEASIGDLGISRPLPLDNRYLWDFVTLPPWRGRGVYPRLLQAMVAAHPDVTRFWIGHDLPNIASARGIAKAGFQEVGLLYRHPDGGFVLVPSGPVERAAAASTLFAVPLAGQFGESPG